MAVTTAALSGTITDVIGDVDSKYLRRVVVAIEANTDGSLLLDTSGDRLMAGAKRVDIDTTTGAYSVTLVRTDSADVLPATGRLYRVHLTYPSGVPGAGNVHRSSGWWALTADGSLSDADKWPGLEVTAVSDALLASLAEMQAEVEARHADVMGVVATTEGLMTSVLGSGGTFDAELAATFVRTISPLDSTYGAVGNDTADDTTALQAAITAAASFGFVLDGRGKTYKTTDGLTVPAGSRLTNLTIHCTGTGKTLIDITGSNVWIQRVSLIGRHATATAAANEIGFRAYGTSAAAPLTNVNILDSSAELLGKNAIDFKWVTGFRVERCDLGDLGYSGVSMLSCINGDVTGNRVDNVLASATFSSNGYGIIASRDATSSLVTDPRSSNIRIHGNVVSNVPWNGIDTHGGSDLTIEGNHVFGCKFGIAVGSCPNGSGVATYAPLRVKVLGNLVDSLLDNGAAESGIIVTGATGATSSDPAVEYAASCSVVGNTVRRHGSESNNNQGAIMARNTSGLVVVGNDVDQPSPHGICLYFDNRKAVVTGNTVVDAWSNTVGVGQASCVASRADNNTGTISSNALHTAGNKSSATYVNTVGLTIAAGTGVAFQTGLNDFSIATTPISGSGAATRFYGAVQVGAGTAAAPSMTFGDDPDTGWFRIAANQMGLTVNGTQQLNWIDGAVIVSKANFSWSCANGLQFGGAGSHKLGFWGKTPVVQPTAVADATDAASVITQLNALLARLRTIGIIAT